MASLCYDQKLLLMLSMKSLRLKSGKAQLFVILIIVALPIMVGSFPKIMKRGGGSSFVCTKGRVDQKGRASCLNPSFPKI